MPVDLGGKTTNKVHPLVLTAGLQERFEGSPKRLDIDIEKARLDLWVLMSDRFHEPERISTTNLGTP